MTTFLFFALIGVSSLVALSDWRKGMYLMVVAGLLQDPVRKLMPGAPGYMVLAFTPVWIAICAVVLFSGNQAWSRFLRVRPELVNSIWFFSFSVVLSFLVLILNYGVGAMPVGLIGLIGYMFPLLAVVIGYFYVRGLNDLVRLMMFYSVAVAVMLTGGLMEYWDLFPDSTLLGTKVLGTTWFRQYTGHIVYMMSGFFRSPDLMGWHAAMLVMFSSLLGVHAKNPVVKAACLVLAIWGATNLMISGRNKMIFMPAVFIAVVGSMNLLKGAVGKVMSIVMVALISLGLALAVNSQLNLDEEFLLYSKKGSGDATERLAEGGLRSVWETYRQSGFFGEGLGSASTGARYGGKGAIRTWQESGPSKIMVELGVIGFFAGGILLAAMLRAIWLQFKRTPVRAPGLQLFLGFLGIVAANFASFVVSHQAFGDPFLVTLAGLFIGIALSASRWATGTSNRAKSAFYQ